MPRNLRTPRLLAKKRACPLGKITRAVCAVNLKFLTLKILFDTLTTPYFILAYQKDTATY